MKNFFLSAPFLAIVFCVACLSSRRNEGFRDEFRKENRSCQGEDSPKKFSPRTPSPKPKILDQKKYWAPSKIPQKKYFKKRHSQSVEKYFQPKK